MAKRNEADPTEAWKLFSNQISIQTKRYAADGKLLKTEHVDLSPRTDGSVPMYRFSLPRDTTRMEIVRNRLQVYANKPNLELPNKILLCAIWVGVTNQSYLNSFTFKWHRLDSAPEEINSESFLFHEGKPNGHSFDGMGSIPFWPSDSPFRWVPDVVPYFHGLVSYLPNGAKKDLANGISLWATPGQHHIPQA